MKRIKLILISLTNINVAIIYFVTIYEQKKNRLRTVRKIPT